MRFKTRIGAVGAALIAGATVGGGGIGHGATPAKAACVTGSVYYQLLNPTQHYVIGPNQCLVPTPWTQCTTVHVPVGSPAFVYADATVTFTCPVAALPAPAAS